MFGTIDANAVSGPSSPFGNPIGMGLVSSTQSDSAGNPVIYGGLTESFPDNWSWVQWDTPNDFPPMYYESDTDRWTSGNGMSAVHWCPQRSSGRPEALEFAVNGQYLPCTIKSPGGQPVIREFDLLAGPNGWANASNPGQYPRTTPQFDNLPSLDQLNTFYMFGTYTLLEARSTGAKGCQANSILVNIGIEVTNIAKTPHQRLLYDVVLSPVCGDVSDPDYAGCRTRITNPTVGEFWTGAAGPRPHIDDQGNINFGIDDIMESYGGSPIIDNNPHGLSLDILTRIKNLIQSGDYGIDKNVADWKITSANFGEAAGGDVFAASRFQGFIPVITTK